MKPIAYISAKEAIEKYKAKRTTPQQAAGYQKTLMRIYPKGVTPERFYRGSSPRFVWLPDRSIRE